MRRPPHFGTSSIRDFFATARERHHIFIKRQQDALWPWTEDEIFCKYKFTNVFRELDRGTVALREMLPVDCARTDLILGNVSWYRMLNREEHSRNIGLTHHWPDTKLKLQQAEQRGEKIFTGCHMHSGSFADNLVSIGALWNERTLLADFCREHQTLYHIFTKLHLTYKHVGRFIAYEIVTDLRHYPALWPDNGSPLDVNSWANVGPGSKRGMERLGLKPSLDSMVELLSIAPQHTKGTCLEPHVSGDHPLRFELREVEHWLCEFDKYERARTGQGVPKQVYTPK